MSEYAEIKRDYEEDVTDRDTGTIGVLINIIENQKDIALTQFRRIECCIYEPDKIQIHIDHGRKDFTALTGGE